MTVKVAEKTKYYIGVSSDSKPSSGCGANSRFYETDTHNKYIYDGSSWHLMPNTDAGSAQMTDCATTSSGVIAEACFFYGLIFKTDGSTDCVVDVYDSLTASGTRLLPSSINIRGYNDLVSVSPSILPVYCSNGVYVDVTSGSSYEYQVEYDA